MQTIENLKETIFTDCKSLIQKLNESDSVEAFVAEQNHLFQLLEKVALLKNLDSINESISNKHIGDLEQIKAEKMETETHIQQLKEEYWKTLEDRENQISQLTAELKISMENLKITENKEDELEDVHSKLPLEDFFVSQKDTVELEPEEKPIEFNEEIEVTPISEIEKTAEIAIEHQEIEKEENRRKIVEFERKEEVSVEKVPVFEDFKPESLAEKKFRLGKIKGLSMVKSLFDDDLADLVENVPEKKTPLQSRNMEPDVMEAEKPKLDFRIDLNDKVAFTKLLFKGDEEDLRATISKLNSYKTLDEAKEYLSELYYENGWQKVDDYAQRLWVLVENKFI